MWQCYFIQLKCLQLSQVNNEEQNIKNNVLTRELSYVKDNELYIDKILVERKEWIPQQLIELFYILKKDWLYKVLYKDMQKSLFKEENVKKFKKLNWLSFTKWIIKDKLRDKNKQISNDNNLKKVVIWDFFLAEKDWLIIQF